MVEYQNICCDIVFYFVKIFVSSSKCLIFAIINISMLIVSVDISI